MKYTIVVSATASDAAPLQYLPPQEQGHLSVGDGLFGQIVENNKGVLTVITEKFAHGAARVRSQVLQGSSIRSCVRDFNCVFHGIGVSQTLDDLGHGGPLLSDSNVNAHQFLFVLCSIVEPLLVDNSVDGNGSFASLTITNNQLTLTTANGHQRVDSLDTSLHRLSDGLSGDNTGSFNTNTLSGSSTKGSSTINGVTQSVNDTSKKLSD